MGQISKFFPWREYYARELDASGAKSFSPGFSARFGRPTAENYELVFLTEVRPNGSSFQILLIFGRVAKILDGNFRDLWRKGPKYLQVKILRLNDRIRVLVARWSKKTDS